MEALERIRRFDALAREVSNVETVQDFDDFAADLVVAWKDGVFDENDEGEKQNVREYLDGIYGVADVLAYTHDDQPLEEEASWAMFAYILLRAFGHS